MSNPSPTTRNRRKKKAPEPSASGARPTLDATEGERAGAAQSGRVPVVFDEGVHPEGRASARATRILNILVALLGLVVTAPIMIAVAILVKLSSPGPVFYVQERVGVDRRASAADRSATRRREDKGGRIFTIYKFRTMYTGSDKEGQVWAKRNDPRVTLVGKILRASRLDELPQLFNVLLGDMNIVGPRPEQPAIFAVLREEIEEYPIRQKVLPGITGLAQVNQSPDESLEDVRKKVEYDLQYIERKGPIHDLWIMLKTLPVVLKRIGW